MGEKRNSLDQDFFSSLDSHESFLTFLWTIIIIIIIINETI